MARQVMAFIRRINKLGLCVDSTDSFKYHIVTIFSVTKIKCLGLAHSHLTELRSCLLFTEVNIACRL